MNFDARRISPETRQAVNALLDKNKKSFDPAAAKRASQAALPLATWVKASVKYSEVLEKIQPLEKEQEHLQWYVLLREYVRVIYTWCDLIIQSCESIEKTIMSSKSPIEAGMHQTDTPYLIVG